MFECRYEQFERALLFSGVAFEPEKENAESSSSILIFHSWVEAYHFRLNESIGTNATLISAEINF